MLQFEWDQHKSEKNIAIRRISFDEASTSFGDPHSLTIYDPVHSEQEERFILIGLSYKSRLLTIVHTERGDRIRIISARKATKNERKQYEKKI